jgi:hypothetical protein
MTDKTPDQMRDRAERAKAEARRGNLAPLLELSDDEHEHILANGLHDRATDVSRNRVRKIYGWSEEKIRRFYPPCDCPRCCEWRMEREMSGG